MSKLVDQLSWSEAEREGLRWLCDAVGGAATATDAVTLPPSLVVAPSPLLALPPPLLLRVLAALPVASLGAAACACVALRDLGYGGNLEAWREGGTLLLDCAAVEIDGSLLRSLRRRGVTSVAAGAAAVDVSDEQVTQLLGSCPQLRRLAVEDCDCLTDAVAPRLGACSR